MNFSTNYYGPAVAPLLENAKRNELGPGTPENGRRAALAALTPESLVAPKKLADRQMALACLAGLWLRHDFLDESHRISQDIAGATGSYWHGILHRREGDFSNAKYWFRRVQQHPVFNALAVEAGRLAAAADAPQQAAYLASQDPWDPFRFVDLCQRALDGPPALESFCRDLQLREWELLFDHCYREAASS